MKTLLFRVLPESGHMNATFGLARALRERGHRVVYASVEDFRDLIESEGFEFYTLEAELIWAGRTRFAVRPIRNPFEWIRVEGARRKWSRLKQEEMLRGDAFIEEVKVVQPDLVLVDSPFDRFAPCLARTNTPFVMLESMVALDQSGLGPPLCSSYIPNGTWPSRLRCGFSWLAYYVERAFKQIFGLPEMVSQSAMRRLCAKVGFDGSQLDFRRYFHFGMKSVPEILLSPPEFDFPRWSKPNQFYARVAASRSRSEGNYDYRFDSVFNRLREAQKKAGGRKLVYCSLGSMSFRYLGAAEFYKTVVAAFRGMPQIDLVLSIGNELSVSQFETGVENVHVFRRVPQLRLLEAADLMITHGGMNSIAECIYAGVPMLVYPGTNKIDQPGNAARVVYHGMGLMGKLRRDSARTIGRKVERILADSSFAEQVGRKGEEMRRNTTTEAIEKTVAHILSFANSGRVSTSRGQQSNVGPRTPEVVGTSDP